MNMLIYEGNQEMYKGLDFSQIRICNQQLDNFPSRFWYCLTLTTLQQYDR
jgi:hypothetical protein